MAHVVQVGAGSGGMVVMDLIARDERVTRITLIEPDIYQPHNVHRHYFPPQDCQRTKGELAKRWVQERRPDLEFCLLQCDVTDGDAQAVIKESLASADLGVCAVDNEPAKFHWDELLRQARLPWTLGEVLSGGIGGFVHYFEPEGPCYGCVASHLQRAVTVEAPGTPDYSQPGGGHPATTVPAAAAAIHSIASLHAVVTLQLLPPRNVTALECFTSLLLTLQHVPDVFETAFRSHRIRIPRMESCLFCGTTASLSPGENLDAALDQALARLDGA